MFVSLSHRNELKILKIEIMKTFKLLSLVLVLATSLTSYGQKDLRFYKGLMFNNTGTTMKFNGVQTKRVVVKDFVIMPEANVYIEDTEIIVDGDAMMNPGSVFTNKGLVIYKGKTNIPSINVIKWERNRPLKKVFSSLKTSKEIITIKRSGQVVANGFYEDIKNVFLSQGIYTIITNGTPIVEKYKIRFKDLDLAAKLKSERVVNLKSASEFASID